MILKQEVVKLKNKCNKLKCSPKVKDRIKREIARYEAINSNSPELGIVREYLDWMLNLPWNNYTKDTNDLVNKVGTDKFIHLLVCIIIAENVAIGNNVKLGVGDEVPNETAPHIYNSGIVTVGEKSIIPDGVSVGKNTVISGVTTAADYENSYLAGGRTLIKAGEQ